MTANTSIAKAPASIYAHRVRHLYIVASLYFVSACAHTAASAPPATFDYENQVKGARRAAEAGSIGRARSAAELAKSQSPERPDAYAVLGYVAATENQLSQSTELYETALRLGSRNRRDYAELASIYDVMKRYTDACRIYEMWIKQQPTDHDMLHELGLTQLLLRRFADAKLSLEAAYRAQSNNNEYARDLAYALLQNKENSAARELLEQLTAKDENDLGAWRMLNVVGTRMGDTKLVEKTNTQIRLLNEKSHQ